MRSLQTTDEVHDVEDKVPVIFVTDQAVYLCKGAWNLLFPSSVWSWEVCPSHGGIPCSSQLFLLSWAIALKRWTTWCLDRSQFSLPLCQLMRYWKRDTITEDYESTNWFQRHWDGWDGLRSESGMNTMLTLLIWMNWHSSLKTCVLKSTNITSRQCCNPGHSMIQRRGTSNSANHLVQMLSCGHDMWT